MCNTDQFPAFFSSYALKVSVAQIDWEFRASVDNALHYGVKVLDGGAHVIMEHGAGPLSRQEGSRKAFRNITHK